MGARFVRGAFYIGSANWFLQVFNLAIALAFARILGPEVFGLYAFVLTINEFINIVNGLSVGLALLQSREESDALYDTGFAIILAQAVLGLLVSVAVAAVLFEYRSAESAGLLLLLALARFPLLLTDIPQAKLQRSLRYGSIALIQMPSRSLPNVLCLWLAWIGWGASSLVLRDVLVVTSYFCASWLLTRYRFSRRWERTAFRRIMSYSSRMFVSRTIDTFLQRFDRLMIGSLFGNTSLGLYHQALFLADLGVQSTAPVGQVTFNLYSRLQDDPERLARAFSIVGFFLVRVFFAGCLVLIIFPTEAIRLLLGEEWLETARILQVLGLYAGLIPLLRNMEILLFARARVLANVRLRLIQLVIFLPGVLLAALHGDMRIVALALLLSTLTALGAAWFMNRPVVSGTALRQFASPLVALTVTGAAFAWLGAQDALEAVPYWVRPVLPPLVFACLIGLIERGRLLTELRYLRSQLLRRGA